MPKIFQVTAIISGHSLTHLTATLAALVVLVIYLLHRQPVFKVKALAILPDPEA